MFRTRVTRAPFALLALSIAAVAPPQGPARSEEPAAPRFVSACMESHLKKGAATAERRCVGLLARSCMNAPQGDTASGQANCLRREAAAWERVMETAWSRLAPRVAAHDAAGRAHDALLDAQQSWEGFRDSECRYAHALWGEGAYREVAAADCRLNLTARRAIQLRAQLGAEG